MVRLQTFLCWKKIGKRVLSLDLYRSIICSTTAAILLPTSGAKPTDERSGVFSECILSLSLSFSPGRQNEGVIHYGHNKQSASAAASVCARCAARVLPLAVHFGNWLLLLWHLSPCYRCDLASKRSHCSKSFFLSSTKNWSKPATKNPPTICHPGEHGAVLNVTDWATVCRSRGKCRSMGGGTSRDHVG